MKVAVFFCTCGGNIAERIDPRQVERQLGELPQVAAWKTCDFLCSEDGKSFLRGEVAAEKPDRVVIGACSPREYEAAFRQVMGEAGLNPHLMQMVNLREQVAWVTPDPAQATCKAVTLLRGAVARVLRHEPLEKKGIEACPDALVIGAGPAGLKAALTLAEAGRQVTLVEKSAVLGGRPVHCEEVFPAMECGSCMLEPVLGELLHGPHAGNIEVLTLAEVAEVAGYFGNFTARIRQRPRYVNTELCIGCNECIPPCPASRPNPYDHGLGTAKAISFPFAGALPNAPYLDEGSCLRFRGEDCRLCQQACPVQGAVVFEDRERVLERTAGAIVVAVGATLYDCKNLPALGHGTQAGVYTSAEFERLLASNGPTGGEILTPEGTPPQAVAIIHCVGSLDAKHMPYCSGVCCQYAFKYNHLIRKKLPGTAVHHLYKELVAPGKEDFALYEHARQDAAGRFIRYRELAEVGVRPSNGTQVVCYRDSSGAEGSLRADLVVLCPAMTPSEEARRLAAILDVPLDRFGFFEELHGRLDAAQSKLRGVYLAGTCQAPMNIQESVSRAMAAAGYILAGLVPGRQLEIEPVVAAVNAERCSGCGTCGAVCPFKAISFTADDGRAEVNALLCRGCGTCGATCPAGAIRCHHFTSEQVLAEMEGVLA